MNKYILSLMILSSLLSPFALSASEAKCEGDNSLPMYGYKPKHKENACDKKFIAEFTQGGKTRQQASLEVSKLGWAAMLKDKDMKTAIMRLNQAWLLDHNNGKAVWGFGVWEALSNRFDKAEGFLLEAEINEKNPGIYIDLGRVTSRIGLMKKDEKKIAKGLDYFQRAKDINKNFIPAYVQTASVYMNQGKFADAWKEVEAAEAINPKAIDLRLITDLEKKMPRPKK